VWEPLTTRRLVIDPLVAPDLGAFTAYRRDPDVARWQSWDVDYDEDAGHRLVQSQPPGLPPPGEWLQLAVRSHDRMILHGDVAVHRMPGQPATFEIGVTLAVASQGRGIGSEAVTRVLQHLFAEGAAHRVVAFCDERNAAVARLLRRVGMRQESHQIEADYLKGEWTTVDGYAILAREHP
jgi:RimJ/RimL family protein N-acetyltransferase